MELEITLLSAKGLKDVGAFSKMDVYVAVTVSGDPRTEQKTPVDEDGGSSPHWNHTMKFVVDEGAIQMNALNLIFQLRHERVLVGDKPVGEVQVPIKDLLSNGGNNKMPIIVEYPVREISGKNKGKLIFSYKFGTSKVRGSEIYPPPQVYPPVMNGSYPPTAPPLGYPPQGTSTMAPPPPLGYPPQGHVITGSPVPPMGYPSQGPPHGAPPPMGYPPQGSPHGAHMPHGYPPSPQLPGYGPPSYGGYPPTPLPAGYQSGGSGYGYQPAQQAKPQKDKKDKKKKKNDKEGVGSGIVAGLMGGLLAGALLDGI